MAGLTMDRPIILASASPRRRELFELLELPFQVFTAAVDETPRAGETPEVLVARLSATKAAAVARSLSMAGRSKASDLTTALSQALVVAADTVVVIDAEILGKPDDTTHAKQMLLRLRDRPHTVHSGVAVVEIGSGRAAIQLSVTIVWMRGYDEAEIETYVATGDPMDKAGAYGIQHPGFRPAAHFEGCFTGVMGLPLGALVDGLAHFGVSPPVDVAAVCRAQTGYPCCRETQASQQPQ